ncbi:MAG: 50S ribosomal protein L10 [Clostridia bacterium]|nr:50S ribosomal protein L10 [Clostridia bacterium]
MPSAKILEQKKAVVAELTEKLKGATAGVVVNYSGITVENDTKLRAELRKANVEYKVYKNTLTARACEEAGLAGLKDQFEGMTAIAISSEDPIAPAKILKEYADKLETFEIKAGFLDGEVMDKDQVLALADIPSKEILIGRIIGSLMSPLYGFAYGLQAIIDKSGEGAAEPAAETTEA